MHWGHRKVGIGGGNVDRVTNGRVPLSGEHYEGSGDGRVRRGQRWRWSVLGFQESMGFQMVLGTWDSLFESLPSPEGSKDPIPNPK